MLIWSGSVQANLARFLGHATLESVFVPEDDRVTGRDRESRLERGRSPGAGHFGRIVDRDGPGFGERADKARGSSGRCERPGDRTKSATLEGHCRVARLKALVAQRGGVAAGVARHSDMAKMTW